MRAIKHRGPDTLDALLEAGWKVPMAPYLILQDLAHRRVVELFTTPEDDDQDLLVLRPRGRALASRDRANLRTALRQIRARAVPYLRGEPAMWTATLARGTHGNPSRFEALREDVVASAARRGYHLQDPSGRAIAAAIGRRKYGAKRFQQMAAAGQRKAVARRAKRNPAVPVAGPVFKLQQVVAAVLHKQGLMWRGIRFYRGYDNDLKVTGLGSNVFANGRNTAALDALGRAAAKCGYVVQVEHPDGLHFYCADASCKLPRSAYANPATVHDLAAARARLRPALTRVGPTRVGDRVVLTHNFVPFEAVVVRVNKKSLTVRDAKRRTWNVPLRG